MIIYSQKPEDKYYETISGHGPSLLVFGENGEQWTTNTLEFFSKQQIPVFFFPWDKVTEIRLQLGFVKYPVSQLWFKEECVREVIGYNDEELHSMVRLFLHKGRSKHE